MATEKDFEWISQALPDIGMQNIPLYVGAEGEVTAESRALLGAADIIATQLGAGKFSLSEIIDQVGTVIADPDKAQALLIEDESGMGSVRITREVTTVWVREQGEAQVPSALLFDTLYLWASYRPED